MTDRRGFLRAAWRSAAVLAGTATAAGAQASGEFRPAGRASSRAADTTNLFVMNQDAYRPVHLPAKPNASPVLDARGVAAVERRLRCPCGCTLDVYACRSSLDACEVAPEIHRDVLDLVGGGYDSEQIVDEFVNIYGQGILMTPPLEGFTLLAWAAPAAFLAIGVAAVIAEARRWRVPDDEAAR